MADPPAVAPKPFVKPADAAPDRGARRPMSQAEYLREQSVVREVLDPLTGRVRYATEGEECGAGRKGGSPTADYFSGTAATAVPHSPRW